VALTLGCAYSAAEVDMPESSAHAALAAERRALRLVLFNL
jgi:hypothetical protein